MMPDRGRVVLRELTGGGDITSSYGRAEGNPVLALFKKQGNPIQR